MYAEGATTPTGKIIYDEEGKPIRLTSGEALSQAAGFRPERLARAGMEKRVLSNIEGHSKDIRDDLYAKFRLARTEEERRKVLRDVERYNLEVMKYQGAIPRVSRETLKRSFIQKPEKSFTRFEQMYAQQEAR